MLKLKLLQEHQEKENQDIPMHKHSFKDNNKYKFNTNKCFNKIHKILLNNKLL